MNLQFIYIHNSPIFRKTFILSLLIACINIKSRLNQILKNKQNLPVIEIGAKKSFSLKKRDQFKRISLCRNYGLLLVTSVCFLRGLGL